MLNMGRMLPPVLLGGAQGVVGGVKRGVTGGVYFLKMIGRKSTSKVLKRDQQMQARSKRHQKMTMRRPPSPEFQLRRLGFVVCGPQSANYDWRP